MQHRLCFFISDLHGHLDRYQKLFYAIEHERPYAIFLGGDLLPSGIMNFSSARQTYQKFIDQVLYPGFFKLQRQLGETYPQVFLILGNDDGRFAEPIIQQMAAEGVWHYAHNCWHELDEFAVFGYSYIPPTPFLLKDWERYDVSRFVDPGCVSPEEGVYSVPVPDDEKRWATIQKDINQSLTNHRMNKCLFLFHAPPYQTSLDRAALDGMMVDLAPCDIHVGSIAIKRFIETDQPYLTLHGHIHESARITGIWKEQIGRTYCLSAAHDTKELALVRFELAHPAFATRELL